MQEKIYDEFVEKSVELTKQIKVGDQFSDDTTQGPLISEEQRTKVLNYIKSGVSQGANLLIGGNKYGDKGFHVEPTVFADVQDDMEIAKDEIFGPVMSIFKFSDIEEAIQRANNTDYGLTAAVFTEDISKAIQVSNALQAGQIYVN